MRILLVNDQFPPASFGGGEVSVRETARALSRLGHDVHVLARHPRDAPLPSGETFRFHPAWTEKRTGFVGGMFEETRAGPARLAKAWAALEASEGPFDVVHANNAVSALAVAKRRVGRARTALTARSYVHVCPLGTGYCAADTGAVTCGSSLECASRRHAGGVAERARAFVAAATYGPAHGALRDALFAFDVVLADSAFVGRVLAASGRAPDAVVYEAIDTAAFAPREAAPPGPPVALFAGRLQKEKGVETLVDAFAKAAANAPADARLALAGSGPAEAAVRKRVEEHGLAGRVDLLGALRPEALPRLYAGASVVVVPSVWPEPFGMVACEALLSGVPVVASRIGGLPEACASESAVRPGVTLVPAGDADALANALAEALSGKAAPVPPSTRAAIVARVDREAVAERLLAAYRGANHAARN